MSQTIFEKDGYLMRSHSETRWAGMMDALQITWEYKPMLFNTRHGAYLPDFYLPRAELFVEVKGPQPSQIEIDKAMDVVSATGCRVAIACGDMFLAPPGIGGGRILVCTRAGLLTYSTFDFHSVIKGCLGEQAYRRYLRAGIKTPHPGAFRADHLLREGLMSTLDRGAREAQLSRVSKALNLSKSARHAQASPAEHAIYQFSKRLSAKEAA